MRNLTTVVAYGVAIPVLPGQKFHCSDIPPGYSTVGVEQVVPAYEDLELEHEGGDGEKHLQQAVHGIILWHKAYIKLVPETKDLDSNATSTAPKPKSPPKHKSPPKPKKFQINE